ncbi:MAG: hypothetical protein QXS81_05550 [Candidatus Micrarchaeaceae archaeon]
MAKQKAFSYYDIEEFLKEAGAERVNEKAVMSFEAELEGYMKELASEAKIFANHAGRSKKITNSDIKLAKACKLRHAYVPAKRQIKQRKKTVAIIIGNGAESNLGKESML